MIFSPIKDKTEYTLSGFPELSGVYGFISDNSISFVKNNAINFGQAGILNINGANTIIKDNNYATKRIIIWKDLIQNIYLQEPEILDEEQAEILSEAQIELPDTAGISIPVNFGVLSTQILLNKKYNSITSYDEYSFYDTISGHLSGFKAPSGFEDFLISTYELYYNAIISGVTPKNFQQGNINTKLSGTYLQLSGEIIDTQGTGQNFTFNSVIAEVEGTSILSSSDYSLFSVVQLTRIY